MLVNPRWIPMKPWNLPTLFRAVKNIYKYIGRVKKHHIYPTWEPTTFIFRGDFTHILGVQKLHFSMGSWGPRGNMYLKYSTFSLICCFGTWGPLIEHLKNFYRYNKNINIIAAKIWIYIYITLRIIGPSKLAILRTLSLLYRFKPFHWRVQDLGNINKYKNKIYIYIYLYTHKYIFLTSVRLCPTYLLQSIYMYIWP